MFTETEQLIINILSDGLPHNRHELRKAIDGEFATLNTVNVHLYSIRRKIRPLGQDIICEFSNRRICYRQVRLLASASDGKR